MTTRDDFDDMPELLPEEQPIAVETPPSKTVIEVDFWNERKGRELLATEGMQKLVGTPRGFTLEEATDCHAALFEPRPSMTERPIDTSRQRWFKMLLESPEYHALHHTTAYDDEMSMAAAQVLAEQWQEYAIANPVVKEEESIEDEVKRIKSIVHAIDKAQEQVEEIQDMQGMGCGIGNGVAKKVDRKMMQALYKRIRNNRSLRRIANLAGKYKRVAASSQRRKTTNVLDTRSGVSFGNDMSRVLPHELAIMDDVDLELDFYRRFSESQLLEWEVTGVEPQGKGPVIWMIDESGSMSSPCSDGGSKFEHAKAMALSAAWVAQHQNRWICLVGWSSSSQVNVLAIPPGGNPREAILEWCEHCFDGGTEPPLAQMDAICKAANAPKGRTDVVLVTDGDVCLPDMTVFMDWKAENMAKLTVLAIGCNNAVLKPYADSMLHVDDLSVGGEASEVLLAF